MFRRIRYRKWLVGGLALAALAAPAAAQAMPLGVGDSAGVALGPGTSAAVRSNMSAAAYAALVAKSEALNARYASVRYGAPDGWYPHMVTVTRQQQSPALVDGRSPDTIDAARAAHSATGFDPNSPETHARLVAQGYIDGSIRTGSTIATPVDGRSPDTIDAAVQAHSPVLTVVRDPGFKWGDFGIGIGVALGAVLLLALGLRVLSNRQGRKPTPVATA
jgi:hypothetical protein